MPVKVQYAVFETDMVFRVTDSMHDLFAAVVYSDGIEVRTYNPDHNGIGITLEGEPLARFVAWLNKRAEEQKEKTNASQRPG